MTGWNKSLTDCVTILMQNGLKLSDARTVGGTMEKSISAMLRYAHRCMARIFAVEQKGGKDEGEGDNEVQKWLRVTNNV